MYNWICRTVLNQGPMGSTKLVKAGQPSQGWGGAKVYRTAQLLSERRTEGNTLEVIEVSNLLSN